MMKMSDTEKSIRRYTILISTMIAIAIISIVSTLGFAMYQRSIFAPPMVYDFSLNELEDGVYAYQEAHVSTLEEWNYTIITVKDTSGNIFTIKGSASIIETDDPPRCVWTHYKYVVRPETAVLYVPAGTVKYIGAVGGR